MKFRYIFYGFLLFGVYQYITMPELHFENVTQATLPQLKEEFCSNVPSLLYERSFESYFRDYKLPDTLNWSSIFLRMTKENYDQGCHRFVLQAYSITLNLRNP